MKNRRCVCAFPVMANYVNKLQKIGRVIGDIWQWQKISIIIFLSVIFLRKGIISFISDGYDRCLVVSNFFFFFFQKCATNTRKKLKLMLFLLNVSKGNCKAIVFIIKAFWPSSYSGESWKWKSHCLSETFRCQKINNSTTSLNLEGKKRKGERRTKKDRGYDTDFEIQLSAPLFET